MSAIVLNLPVPPSVNAMYANSKNGKGRGRYKTKAYKDWLAEANISLLQQRFLWRGHELKGPAKLTVRLPKATRGDIDNRIKATSDLLVSAGITVDDRHHHKISIERADVQFCVVTIEPWEGAWEGQTSSHGEAEKSGGFQP